MKALSASIVILAAATLILVASGADREASPPAPENGGPAPKNLPELIELPGQTLVFKPTRDDITVGCVIFSLHHADMGKAVPLQAIRVNGKTPDSPELNLKQLGKNQFELPPLKIEFSSKELGGPLYLTVKVWFNELTNQHDSPLYENVPDRYALLSYCTKEDDDPSKVNARLGANRVTTLKDFKEALTKPFVVKLKPQPLQAEWGRYPMLPPGNLVSPDDLKAIEKSVRDRGEQFLIVISVANADLATVTVGEGSIFRAARTYKVVRKEGTWRVDHVMPIPQYSW